jgi:hypothetical protein
MDGESMVGCTNRREGGGACKCAVQSVHVHTHFHPDDGGDVKEALRADVGLGS